MLSPNYLLLYVVCFLKFAMAVSAQFDANRSCQVFVGTGSVSLADMMGALLSWYENPDFQPSIPVLCDFRSCDWMPMYQEFSLMSGPVAGRINQSQAGGRVAFILRDEVEAAMMDFVGATHGWALEWKSFVAESEASNWLLEA